MGSYKTTEAYVKTQLKGNDSKMFIEKSPKKTFLDHHLKVKKIVPAPGHYKLDSLDQAHKRISTSPISIRPKRH